MLKAEVDKANRKIDMTKKKTIDITQIRERNDQLFIERTFFNKMRAEE